MGISRRSLLKGLGATPALVPFIPLLDAEAETGEYPTRVVFVFTPNGLRRESFASSGNGADFTLGPAISALNGFKDRLIVLEGVDQAAYFHEPVSNGHFPPLYQLLTGRPTQNQETVSGPTIDQWIADRLESSAAFDSILLGVEANDRVFYRGPFNGLPPINDPQVALSTIFGDPDLDPFEVEQLAASRRTLLDRVAAELNEVRARVGAADKQKLDDHLDGVDRISQRLLGTNDCGVPDLDEDGGFRETGTNQMRLLTNALACDRTRVASLQWSRPVSQKVMGWLGTNEGHHNLAHRMTSLPTSTNDEQYDDCGRWYAEQFATLLGMLDGVTEGSETLLDHTVVLWFSEHGWDSSAQHDRRDIPHILAGSGCGFLDTGRLVRFPDGIANNDVYLTMAHAMGLTNEETFGLPELSNGPLSELMA